jgi:hypothetical protein
MVVPLQRCETGAQAGLGMQGGGKAALRRRAACEQAHGS